MVSTRKKIQQKERLLSQLDVFDQDDIIGKIASVGIQDVEMDSGKVDPKITVKNNGMESTNENVNNIQTLERSFTNGTRKEMGNYVIKVEDSIQKATWLLWITLLHQELN